MPCSSEVLGDSFRVLYDTGSDYAIPVWAEVTSVGDIGLDLAKEQVEIPIRTLYKHYQEGRQDWTFSMEVNWNPGEQFFDALLAALNTGGNLHLGLTDLPAPGGTPAGMVFHAWFVVTGNINANLDSPATVSVEAKISFYRGDDCSEVPGLIPAPVGP